MITASRNSCRADDHWCASAPGPIHTPRSSNASPNLAPERYDYDDSSFKPTMVWAIAFVEKGNNLGLGRVMPQIGNNGSEAKTPTKKIAKKKAKASPKSRRSSLLNKSDMTAKSGASRSSLSRSFSAPRYDSKASATLMQPPQPGPLLTPF